MIALSQNNVNCECVAVLAPASYLHYDKIHTLSKRISAYKLCPELKCDFNMIGENAYSIEGRVEFTVDVIDPVRAYCELMRKWFDFGVLKSAMTGSGTASKVDLLVFPVTEGTYLILFF